MFWQEHISTISETGIYESAERSIAAAAQWLKLGVEAIGAIVIGVGVIIAIYQFAAHYRNEQAGNFNRVRLTLGKYLALALEFQLGADIIGTAIAPTWEQIGKLGAIALIRTALNYFLTKELAEERKREAAAQMPISQTPET